MVLDQMAAGHEVSGDQTRAWPTALAGLALALPGTFLLRRLPTHRVAWLLSVGGLAWCVDAVAASWTQYVVHVRPDLPGASVTFFIDARLAAALVLPLSLVLLVFPDGRLPGSGWLRRGAFLTLGGVIASPVVLCLVPSAAAQRYDGEALPEAYGALDLDPISVPAPYRVWEAFLTLSTVALVMSLVVPAIVLVARLRGSQGERRAQLLSLALSGTLAVALLATSPVLPDAAVAVTLPVAVALLSVGIVTAVLRFRLYDLDLLLGWTLLYGALGAVLVAVDVGIFTLSGSILDTRGSALAGTFAVALLYGPMRVRLHQAVQRLVRGRRDDPYAVVSALAQRLEGSASADDQLRAVVQSMAMAFRSRYVRVEVARNGGGTVVAEQGRRTSDTVTLPVSYAGEIIGHLSYAPAPGRQLSEDDQHLLSDVLRQAAVAYRAAQLAEQLQERRGDLVAAREEERRRLRRDLHDGLGPALGAASLRIETARNLFASDPTSADELLAGAVEDVSEVLQDVRRLVHGLRPPALDELGLVGAIKQHADRVERGGAGALAVRVEATGALADLPAAVEVAAYRIICEALENVARHAAATCALVRIHGGRSLAVEVADNGGGLASNVVPGVGLQSIRERAAELGGTAIISARHERGTQVSATLPLVLPTESEARS